MTDLVVPPQWARLGAEEFRGTVMVIGASDTGKSTLARYLFQRLCQGGARAAYLDADMGQSTLGLPTTLTLALAAEPGDDRLPPRGERVAYFVGSITPRGHMLPAVIGAYRLQQKALALGAEAIVVDTTGMVEEAQGGKALKQWKIELLEPELLVGLQSRDELEPILWPLRRDGRVRTVELSVSPYVVARSREARINRRQERLARYFDGARSWQVTLRRMAVYDLGRLAPGALMAFQDGEGYALGLGVVERADRTAGTVEVRTPLASLEGVSSGRFGAARWDIVHRREL